LKQREKIYEWQFWTGIVVFIVMIGIVVAGISMSWLQFWAYYRQLRQLTLREVRTNAIATTAVPSVEGVGGKSEVPSNQSEAATAGQTELTKQLSQNIKLSATSLEITTPIVGIIILALSLAFFFLYLHFVYPIQ
jgi:hypothetical protein